MYYIFHLYERYSSMKTRQARVENTIKDNESLRLRRAQLAWRLRFYNAESADVRRSHRAKGDA